MRPIWPISQIKRKLHEREAKYKDETPTDKAARRTATATIWIAAFTVVLAIVGAITLYEVYKGGEDTGKLAQAAVDQAAALKLQVQRMENLASAAVAQAIAAQTAATAAESAADTAKRSVDLSIRSFRQEERAYVSTTVFRMNSPPTCRPLPNGNIHICVDVFFLNSGRTPAVGEYVTRLITWGPDAKKTIEAMNVPPYIAPSELSAPGQEAIKFVTAVSEPVDMKTAQAPLDAKTPDTLVYVYGVVQYADIFGDQHQTGYCAQRVLNSESFIGCGFGSWFETKKQGKTN